MLQRKVLEQHATLNWLEKAVKDHQATLKHLWGPLMALTERLTRAKEAQLGMIAGQLYVLLFVLFDSSLHRQQVLQALQGHLGSGQKAEEDVALQVGCGAGSAASMDNR